MQAIILAAGQGTRLRPLTDDLPKCLVPVGAQALLDRHLAVLAAGGVSPVTVVGGYRADCLENRGFSLLRNPDFASTNMVWSLRCAFDTFASGCVLAYGDIVYSPPVLEALLRHPGDLCVVVDRGWEAYWNVRFDSPLDDAETLRVAPSGVLVEIGNKAKTTDEIQGQYIGLMKFSAQGAKIVCDLVEKTLAENGTLNGKAVEKAYTTDLLQELITLGHTLHPVWIDGGWAEIDTLSDIPVAEERMRYWANIPSSF
ncbi:MAG: phosphocholine cytidylyltransferase family protein [Candidatus Accumulibacter sp.]|jgi:choline kinase|nr:phosphocholine cytidylyltransferase family protein [Accumulibacter sp.]